MLPIGKRQAHKEKVKTERQIIMSMHTSKFLPADLTALVAVQVTQFHSDVQLR